MSTDQQLDQAWKIHEKGEYAKAEKIYTEVISKEPKNPKAWCFLGVNKHLQKKYKEAVHAYEKAIEIRPNFVMAYNNLGNAYKELRRTDDAVSAYKKAIALQPDYIYAYKNMGATLAWEGRLEEAADAFRGAIKLDPKDARSHKDLGLVHLLEGRYKEGWDEYYWRWDGEKLKLPKFKQPIWDGSSLDGKTILLTCEQGLGDTVNFIRYAQELKTLYDCKIIAVCQTPLLPLLSSCPGVDVLLNPDEKIPAFDVYAPFLNLPGIMRHDNESFPNVTPYIAPDPRLVAKWRDELAKYDGIKIAIAWQGSKTHEADHRRSMALKLFSPLGQLEGIQLFSLQKNFGAEQLETLGSHAELMNIVSFGDEFDNEEGAFMDSAAVLENIDLLITTDSAIAHVAGALGKPTWLLLGYVPDWRWTMSGGDSTPWYPEMKLFRQPENHDWQSVFQMVQQELLKLEGVKLRKPEDYTITTTGFNRLKRGKNGLILFNHNDRYIGKSMDLYGDFSEGEVRLFEDLINAGDTIIEGGANNGVHTLPIAKRAGPKGMVYAFEPQRVVFQNLCANIALNSLPNVDCRQQALGDKPGTTQIPPLDYNTFNNYGGLELNEKWVGESVAITTLDDLKVANCHFIKLDVEGMELPALKGGEQLIQKYKPILYLENDRENNSKPLIQYLMDQGYKLFWHTPPLYDKHNFYKNSSNEFSDIVSLNMLCLHESAKEDLAKVEARPDLAAIKSADERPTHYYGA